MLGHMQKVIFFWAQMKKHPNCQLGHFCPEPFNYCIINTMSCMKGEMWKHNWGAPGKNILTDIFGFFSFVPKSGWFFACDPTLLRKFFWAGLFFISKNKRMQKALFFTVALFDCLIRASTEFNDINTIQSFHWGL